MKKHSRIFIAYLTLLAVFVVFNCMCAYAFQIQSNQKTEDHCHTSGAQKKTAAENCCDTCDFDKSAVLEKNTSRLLTPALDTLFSQFVLISGPENNSDLRQWNAVRFLFPDPRREILLGYHAALRAPPQM